MKAIPTLAKLYAAQKISEEQFTELVQLLAKIKELKRSYDVDKLEDLNEELKKARTKDIINKTVEQLANMMKAPWRYYHLEDLLAQLQAFRDYPYVVLDTYFSHPNEEEVTFECRGTRPFSENLPIALYELLPGTYTYRWERPRKIVTGGLKRLLGGIYVTADLKGVIEGDVIEEIPGDQIPSDFPTDVIKLPEGREALTVLKPKTMKAIKIPNWWYQTAPGVPVCPSCSRIPDGDEIGKSVDFCPECRGIYSVRTRTIPETFAKSWFIVNTGSEIQSLKEIGFSLREGKFDPPLIVHLPKLADDLFKDIFFVEDVQVTHFYYELQRSYTNRRISTNPMSIYFRFENKPVALGAKLVTDGFVFPYNDLVIEEFIDKLLRDKDTLLEVRSAVVQFLFNTTREALKKDLGYFQYNRVFKALIHDLLKSNELVFPSNLESIQSRVTVLLDDEEKLTELIESQKPELPEKRAKHIVKMVLENRERFEKIDEADFREFLSIVLVHSLAHAVLSSLQKTSGAPDHATGYFFDTNKKEIYAFDMVSGGSGLSETTKENLYIPFSYRNAIIRQRLGRFDTTPTFLPTRDFLTYFEEYFVECDDYVSVRILFEMVKHIEISFLWDLWKSTDKRSRFMKNLIENHRLLLEDKADFLEFNIRNGTALLFKYIQTKLSIMDYFDLFPLHQCPDLTYDFLAENVSGRELRQLLRHDDPERRKQELSDLLSLCYASCPTCSLPSKCIYGYFEPKYYINHRILHLFHDYLIRNERIRASNTNEFVSSVKSMLKEAKVAYIEVSSSDSGLDVISPFIGYRDGREFKVKVNEDSDMIYTTTNYKSSQATALFDEIKVTDGVVQIPQKLLIKLEMS